MEESKEVTQAPISADPTAQPIQSSDPRPTSPTPAPVTPPVSSDNQIPVSGQQGIRVDIIFWVALVLVILALIGGGVYYFYNTQKAVLPTPTPIESLAPTNSPTEIPTSSPSASPKSSPTVTPSGSPKSSPSSGY